MSNGNYFPGLMYVNNEAIPPGSDESTGFYPPEEANPSDGACGNTALGETMGYTLTGGSMAAIYGITLCPAVFTQPTTSSLGTPAAGGGITEIDRFKDTGGMITLHEFVHLVTLNGKKRRRA